MKKGQHEMQGSQEETKDSLLKVQRKIQKSEENVQKSHLDTKKSHKDLRNTLERKVCGNKDKEDKYVPVFTVNVPTSPLPVLASPVSLTACPMPVKMPSYERKPSWKVYRTQFSILFEANVWTEEVKL
ncbi:hypothetical protein TNCV_3674511 [Trichonephila clavipes]|nr:hypothetical protein TNCV_3674511 [Trichonephila clavipes]